ncbi:MAG: hypothetical protein L0K27_06475 [Corynebacterium nuruki]|jgi:hypothetical protein|nr:hypothetical protein [Corynebacterium nuruki]
MPRTTRSRSRRRGTGPFDPYTGADLGEGEWIDYSPAQQAGLDAPRYCPECGRRRTVQVTPHGWTAVCPRHGETDSEMLGQR